MADCSLSVHACVCACVRACVYACVCVCACVCVRVCMCEHLWAHDTIFFSHSWTVLCDVFFMICMLIVAIVTTIVISAGLLVFCKNLSKAVLHKTYVIFAVNIKGEVKPKIKFSPVVVFGVLSRMVLVRGRKLRRSLPPLFPIELAHFHRNWVTAPY